MSCFIFLATNKPHGLTLWAIVTGVVLLGGFLIARKRAPELEEIAKSDMDMEMIINLAQSSAQDIHLLFRRPREEALRTVRDNEAYITFYSPRQGIPHKLAPNHYCFPMMQADVYDSIVALLKIVEYEMSEHQITVQLGWPMSSWLDRISIGVMVFKLMQLPRVFPKFTFLIKHAPLPSGAVTTASRKGLAGRVVTGIKKKIKKSS